MSFKDKILKLLNKVYREDEYTQELLKPLDKQINNINDVIEAITNNFFFDKLNESGCKWYEKLLNITPQANQTLEDRRSSIQLKWLSNSHNDIELIQLFCDVWKNGNIVVDFVNGKIQLTFVNEYGIPEDLDILLQSLELIKPAHLAYYLIYKYLLIKDIHEVKTIDEMEDIIINMFAF